MTAETSDRTQRVTLNDAARAAAATLNSDAISASTVATVVHCIDLVALWLVGVLASLLVATQDAPALGFRELVLIAATPVIATTAFQWLRLYEVGALQNHVTSLARILSVWAICVAISATIAYFYGTSGSRRWLVAELLMGGAWLILARALVSARVSVWIRQGRLGRRVVLVGGGPETARLIAALESTVASGIQICGIFDDRGSDRSPNEIGGYPKLGTIAELVEFARLAHVDLLIVSLPLTAEARILQLLKQLWVLPVDIRLSALGSRLRLTPRSYSHIGSVPFLDLFDRPIQGWSSLLKRVFDVGIATLALVCLSPLLAGAAIAVRLDSPGPILFRQKRYGFNNDIIEVFKFRSMYHHMSDPSAKVAVTRGDARVTRVGRFIRKTSIDELPQLFNVLIGNLSLVGPRPHAVNAHTENRLWDEVVDGYFARHKVKPGITGWAQINGWRGEVDTPEKIQRRVEYDLDYIERWSVLFDLYILMMTPLSLVHSENAY